ncbi:LicD family protein [Nitrincola schmidtii]|uniref:LicD family protein n=1 Tax=Nitrincola schmidtii TaxID=1730894 RepID=UPI00124EA783|nr:LicD family protein [Nitrincola schmidtii]
MSFKLLKRKIISLLGMNIKYVYDLLIYCFNVTSSNRLIKKARYYEFKRNFLLANHFGNEFNDPLVDLSIFRFDDTYIKISGIKFSVVRSPVGLLVKFSCPSYYNIDSVELLCNEFLLRAINLKKGSRYSTVKYFIRRSSLKFLPRSFYIKFRANFNCGKLIQPDPIFAFINPIGINLEVPCDIRVLNKKGFPVYTISKNIQVQNQQVLLYERVSCFLKERFGIELFALYGTLLGIVRDGKLIEHDDDFDVGFYLDAYSQESVKKDLIKIMMALVENGFIVSVNGRGRAFCVWDSLSSHTSRLDVRAVWYQDGKTWAHLQACLDMTKDDFLPAIYREVNGIRVLIPKNAETFLMQNYGSTWRIPDPSYSNASVSIPEKVHKHLSLTTFSIKELKEIKKSIRGDCSHNFIPKQLLPLSDFIDLQDD